MPAREIGQGQARRQRWLTALVVAGLSVAAIAVGISYWRGTDHRNGPAQIPPSPPADITQQLSGYTFTRTDQNHPVFTIHAAHTVSYKDSKSTTLDDVLVKVYGHKGDNGDLLRTDRCQYNPLTGDFTAAGPVQIELSAHSNDTPDSGVHGKHRVVVETSKVTYQQQDALADTDAPVKFRMGSASGTANGMAYAVQDGWLELKHNVALELAQGTEKAPQAPIHLTASELRYDRDGGTMTLAGPVAISQVESHAVADHATIQLNDHNRLSRVILTGNAKAFDVTPLRTVELDSDRVQGDFDPVSGELRHVIVDKAQISENKGKSSVSHLIAQNVDMDFVGKQPRPLYGVAKGNVKIDMESQPVKDVSDKTAVRKAPEKKSLTSSEVRFAFQPGTQTLKHAETAGPGIMTITSADPKTGEKVIKAGQFLMAFDDRSRIESLHGTAPTEVTFLPAHSAPSSIVPQSSTADLLNAIFDPGTQLLREVVQTGNFQYQDGDRRASADNAHYDAHAQTILLLGHPQVWDPENRVKSQKITMDMRTNTSTGDGNVQAVHLQEPAAGAIPPRTPALPTNVLADKMVARKQSQTIHFEGHVRAWQGTSVVESTSLDLYRAQKRVSSGSEVVTSFLQPAQAKTGPDGKPGAPGEPRPVTIHADSLEYLEEGQSAKYKGNVRMVTEGTTMLSDRLDVYFTQGDTMGGSEVDRAEADGHVKVTQPGRIGTGNHAQYFAGPGKVILTGGPPYLEDEEQGSTTGQSLTFFIHDDRLFVDGGDKSPSFTKHRVAP